MRALLYKLYGLTMVGPPSAEDVKRMVVLSAIHDNYQFELHWQPLDGQSWETGVGDEYETRTAIRTLWDLCGKEGTEIRIRGWCAPTGAREGHLVTVYTGAVNAGAIAPELPAPHQLLKLLVDGASESVLADISQDG